MLVSHRHQAVFVRVPKTASASASAVLLRSGDWRKVPGGTFGTRYIYHEIRRPPGAEGYRAYLVVRNPWWRLLSWWRFVVVRGMKSYAPFETFRDFLAFAIDHRDANLEPSYDGDPGPFPFRQIFWPLSRWCDWLGNHSALRYEDYPECLAAMPGVGRPPDRVPVSHRLERKRAPLVAYYGPTETEMLYEHSGEDFDRLGYPTELPKDPLFPAARRRSFRHPRTLQEEME